MRCVLSICRSSFLQIHNVFMCEANGAVLCNALVVDCTCGVAQVCCDLAHANLVRLLGYGTRSGLLLVQEYMGGGGLDVQVGRFRWPPPCKIDTPNNCSVYLTGSGFISTLPPCMTHHIATVCVFTGRVGRVHQLYTEMWQPSRIQVSDAARCHTPLCKLHLYLRSCIHTASRVFFTEAAVCVSRCGVWRNKWRLEW